MVWCVCYVFVVGLLGDFDFGLGFDDVVYVGCG